MRELSHRSKEALAGVFSGLAVLSLVVAAGVIVSGLYRNRVLPNTFVAGTAVGGAQAADAAGTIGDTAINLERQPLTLSLNDQTAQVTLKDLGVDININDTTSHIYTTTGSWQWASYSYWVNFFQTKHVGLSYTIDDGTLVKTLESKFSLSSSAKNATLSIVNNVITVTPGQAGATFNTDDLKTSLAKYLAGQGGNKIAVSAQMAQPPITTDSANQTKAQVEKAITSVYLNANGQNYTLPASSIIPDVTFADAGDHYNWTIDQTELASTITATVGKKFNVAMVPKVVQADANSTVTNDGSDGKQVDSKTLAASIIKAITAGTNTQVAPLVVPISTIPFTTQTVNPVYTLGLYPGMYLDISLSKQKLTIINGTTVISQYTTSTGAWNTPTPTGTLYIFNKIREPFSAEFNLWMPYWNGLAKAPDGTGYDGYGIHGIVCWDQACNYREGANHIGTPVSHGCIRVDDAGIAYIYNNVPIGTPVVIHN